MVKTSLLLVIILAFCTCEQPGNTADGSTDSSPTSLEDAIQDRINAIEDGGSFTVLAYDAVITVSGETATTAPYTGLSYNYNIQELTVRDNSTGQIMYPDDPVHWPNQTFIDWWHTSVGWEYWSSSLP